MTAADLFTVAVAAEAIRMDRETGQALAAAVIVTAHQYADFTLGEPDLAACAVAYVRWQYGRGPKPRWWGMP